MNINEARLIRELKKNMTYRRLAEVYYTETDDGYGNQGFGEELCKEALILLFPGKDIWKTRGENESSEFGLENRSYLGNFYWWE